MLHRPATYCKLVWPLLIVWVCGSCEEVVDPDLVAGPPILVANARFYPNSSETVLELSSTAPFNSPDPNPPVNNALVRVRETGGITNLFREEGTTGIYRPINQDFTLSAFKQYTLEVNNSGEVFIASTNPRNTPAIDSLTYREVVNDPELEDGIYVSFYFQEPNSSGNFYYWEVWQNGIEISQGDLNIASDDNINGSYIELELPYVFAQGDVAVVRLNALPKQNYEYLQALKLLTTSGSPSQAIPENPPSNFESVEGLNIIGQFIALLPQTDTLVIR